MTAPVKTESKAKGFVNSLKKKELGLPIWAWGIIVAVVIVAFYLHSKKAGKASNTGTAQPLTGGTATAPNDTSGAGGGTDPSGSSGSGADDLSSELAAQTDAINAQSQQLASEFSDQTDLLQSYLDSANGETSPGTSPGGNPSATTSVAGVGPLNWGGTHFTSQAQFNAYLKARGISAAHFRVMHPAAYAHYLALPKGVAKIKPKKKGASTAGLVRAGKKTTSKARGALKARTRTTSNRPVKQHVVSQHKSPALSSSLLRSSTTHAKHQTVFHPAAVRGSELARKNSANEGFTEARSPAKTPAKTAAKPKPRNEHAKPAPRNRRPPVKRHK